MCNYILHLEGNVVVTPVAPSTIPLSLFIDIEQSEDWDLKRFEFSQDQ